MLLQSVCNSKYLGWESAEKLQQVESLVLYSSVRRANHAMDRLA